MASFLTEAPIDVAAVLSGVTGPGHGGVASFVGVVRDHHLGRGVTAITYVAYDMMAEDVAVAIVSEAETRWPVRVVVRHRLGRLVVGEVAVAVVVAGVHRDEAFAACRWVIDAIKARVPIWKHEAYSDGSTAWVDPTAASVRT
jgi:molybdopterin synthase catalytic subunit